MTDTISYFKSGIGNLILATPAWLALASMDRSRKIDVCVDGSWVDPRVSAIMDILRNLPFVNEIVPWSEGMREYRSYFVPVQSFGAGESAGRYFAQKRKDKWKGYAWPRIRWDKFPTLSEYDCNMNLARIGGYFGDDIPQFVPIATRPVLDLPKPIIGICNSAFVHQGSGANKRWPNFKPLVEMIHENTKGSVVGVGGKGDLEGVVCDKDYTGKLSFTETAKVISQVDVFVATDTGCMHAADAVGVPLIALFGPTLTSKNGPVGINSHVVKSPERCSPCQYGDHFYTCGNHKCMSSITAETVMSKIMDVLGERSRVEVSTKKKGKPRKSADQAIFEARP